MADNWEIAGKLRALVEGGAGDFEVAGEAVEHLGAVAGALAVEQHMRIDEPAGFPIGEHLRHLDAALAGEVGFFDPALQFGVSLRCGGGDERTSGHGEEGRLV